MTPRSRGLSSMLAIAAIAGMMAPPGALGFGGSGGPVTVDVDPELHRRMDEITRNSESRWMEKAAQKRQQRAAKRVKN